jgi:hypothetical protein
MRTCASEKSGLLQRRQSQKKEADPPAKAPEALAPASATPAADNKVLIHASYTPLTRLLHAPEALAPASATPAADKVCSSLALLVQYLLY